MSPQAGWLLQEQVVPRLRSVIPHAVHCVGCEDAEELIQDATALAAGSLLTFARHDVIEMYRLMGYKTQ